MRFASASSAIATNDSRGGALAKRVSGVAFAAFEIATRVVSIGGVAGGGGRNRAFIWHHNVVFADAQFFAAVRPYRNGDRADKLGVAWAFWDLGAIIVRVANRATHALGAGAAWLTFDGNLQARSRHAIE